MVRDILELLLSAANLKARPDSSEASLRSTSGKIHYWVKTACRNDSPYFPIVIMPSLRQSEELDLDLLINNHTSSLLKNACSVFRGFHEQMLW